MLIQFDDRSLVGREGESVLECLERHGEQVESFCRSGACQSCLMRADSGDVPAAAQQGLKPVWRQQGYFLACMCRPAGELRVSRVDAAQQYASRVLSVEQLADEVIRVVLERPADLVYEAGQFIQLVRPADGLMRPYSLASLPEDGVLDLHVAVLPGGQMSQWLSGAAGEAIEIRGPFGECFYQDREPDRALLLAGTGTGLAPLLGVVRAALKAGHRAPIRLMHGAVRLQDLYYWTELKRLQQEHPQLEIVGSVLSEAEVSELLSEDDAGILHEPLDQLVMGRKESLAGSRIYLCGDPGLVQKLRKQIYLAGTPLDQIHSDAFARRPAA